MYPIARDQWDGSFSEEDLTQEQRVEQWSQNSEDLFRSGNVDESAEIDENIKTLLSNIPKDEGHGYRHGSDWFEYQWSRVYARENQRKDDIPWNSFGRGKVLLSNEESIGIDTSELPTSTDADEYETDSEYSWAISEGTGDAREDVMLQSRCSEGPPSSHGDKYPIKTRDKNTLQRHDSSGSAVRFAIDERLPPKMPSRNVGAPAQIPPKPIEVFNGSSNDGLGQRSIEAQVPIVDSTRQKSPSPAPALGSQSLSAANTLSREAMKADLWFQQLSSTHDLIAGQENKFLKDCGKIKIAILDSGLAFNGAREIRNISSFRSRIVTGSSFIGSDKPWNEDDFGHGTAVTSLVARVAPNAEIYIARVLKYIEQEDRCVVDKDAIAEAITYAAEEWKVDIINMSFGWNYNDHSGVEKALSKAAERHLDEKAQPVLMFAATSNYGLGPPNHILWPARSPRVIAIDAADGQGAEWDDNPKPKDSSGMLRFTALGVDVSCHYPLHRQPPNTPSGTMVRQTGTSFACAVASGLAALVLEFAKQPPCGWISDLLDRLKHREILQRVFLKMSDSKNVEEFHFLYPWALLQGSEDDRYGGDATPPSARWDAAYEIAKVLDKEFGSHLKERFFAEYEERR